MKKPEEEGLLFTLSVEEMLQTNFLMKNNFKVDKPLFIAKTRDLEDPFQENWQKSTDDINKTESDKDYTDKQLLMTQDLNELMVSARDQVQTVFYYLDCAFPGNPAIHAIFGKDRYDGARNNPQKLHNLMLKCDVASENPEYFEALKAKGFTQDMKDEFKVIAKKLIEQIDKREAYMSARKLTTQERIKILNEIWHHMSKVNAASKLVFKTDYARQQQYLLYHSKPKGNNNGKDETAVN